MNGVQVKLPAGFEVRAGEVIRDCWIKPMTGRVRSILGERAAQDDPGRIYQTILGKCVLKLGEYEYEKDVPKEILDKLLVGDRDFLLMKIREISLGKWLKADIKCSGCSSELELEFNIDDIDVVEIGDNQEWNENGFRVFSIKGDGWEGEFRYPNGSHQTKISRMMSRKNRQQNPFLVQSKMEALCMVSLDEKPISGKEAEDFILDLPLPDVEVVDDIFVNKMPGPNFQFKDTCPDCDREILLGISDVDFFLRLTTRNG